MSGYDNMKSDEYNSKKVIHNEVLAVERHNVNVSECPQQIFLDSQSIGRRVALDSIADM